MWAMEGLSLFARNAGHFDEATRAALEVQTLAQELGDEDREKMAVGWLGFIALAQGDYDRTERLAHQAIAMRGQFSTDWVVYFQWGYLGQAAHGKGDLISARTYYEDALAAEQPRSDPFNTAIILGYLALLDCQEGAYPEAATRLMKALTNWRDLSNQENIAECLAQVAVLANAIGDREMSVHYLAAGIALRDAIGHAFVLPERAAYERAEQSLRETLSPDVYARAYQAGADQPLDTVLDKASAFLTRICSADDATPSVRNAQPFGLTPRERDVLRLLATGHTDRAIADELFIGTRTVETHVSNLIAKLGVHNRTEAATRAMQTGLVDGRR
jgi:DNA-binding CsgD family transcriptional regulator/tetratricopeptide (TPR) repeat protein